MSILGIEGLFIIGRQVATDWGKIIDILAINEKGQLYVVELKREKTPRDAVAQLLDYGAWVGTLGYQQLQEIYSQYYITYHEIIQDLPETIEDVYAQHFGEAPEVFNSEHHLVLAASELDASSERIVAYLRETYGVFINVVFFKHFQDGANGYLARGWLVEPEEAAITTRRSGRISKRREEEPWNGRDFYISFGEDESRS